MRSFLLLPALLLLGCPSEGPAPEPEPEGPSWCERMGWTERAFVEEGRFGHQRRDLAEDFLVATTAGDWWFREQFTGCEVYVFVPDRYTVSPLDGTPLLTVEADLLELVETSPPNVHYFFYTQSGDGRAFSEAMQERVESVLAQVDGADWWQERLHVLTLSIEEEGSWLDDADAAGTPGFLIDRFQQIRHIGNLADVTRYSSALEQAGAWPWEQNVAYVAHEAQYANHRSDLEDRLAEHDWTERWVWYDENIQANGRNTVPVELPDAETMAGFDTLWVDLRHVCDPSVQEQGNCDAWDAGNRLHLCEVDDPSTCDELVARWITTYHREGRWLVDASEVLPLLRDGGTRHLRYVGARGGHYISVRLLFAEAGKGMQPFASEPLWTGGTWSETYDEDHAPLTIDVPADAQAVHLVVTVSGHGQGGDDNCAEFCQHDHTFTVGGQSFLIDHSYIGDVHGCLNQIDEGTVPNQHGTWWFARTSWCPGKQVDPHVFDITEQVTPGQPATIEYDTNWNEEVGFNQRVNGGNINLQSWVTYWR